MLFLYRLPVRTIMKVGQVETKSRWPFRYSISGLLYIPTGLVAVFHPSLGGKKEGIEGSHSRGVISMSVGLLRLFLNFHRRKST